MINNHQEILQIQQAIRNSQTGLKLEKIERWQKFRTEESAVDWIDLLGPTAVVLTHQEHFLKFALLWVKNLEEQKFRQFILATTVHDLGEAKLGDIANPDKTTIDEANEVDFALEAILSLPLEHPLIQELITAYLEVVRGDNESLHYLFKALERTEYLDTAIHLFKKLSEGNSMEKGWLMIARVLAFDLPKVIKYAETLPNIVGEYLIANQELINRMFQESAFIVDHEFENHFNDAKTLWQSTTSSQKQSH